jgi:sec-independent protein translocase protein TatC
VFSQALLAVPMWILFEAGLLCGSMVKKREEEFRGDADGSEPDPGDQPPVSRP